VTYFYIVKQGPELVSECWSDSYHRLDVPSIIVELLTIQDVP